MQLPSECWCTPMKTVANRSVVSRPWINLTNIDDRRFKNRFWILALTTHTLRHRWHHVVLDRRCAWTLTEDCHSVRATSEEIYVVLDPPESRHLILETDISWCTRVARIQETLSTKIFHHKTTIWKHIHFCCETIFWTSNEMCVFFSGQ